jgi:hypothetical protein
MADLCCDSAARGARGPYSTSLHRGSSSGGAKDRRWCCGLVQPVESSSRASVRPDESSSGASNITFISISRAILFFPKKCMFQDVSDFLQYFIKMTKNQLWKTLGTVPSLLHHQVKINSDDRVFHERCWDL